MPPPESPGLALVISAPSGTGKSTLIKRLVNEFPVFSFSVSYTTREPRTGEQDGRDYHFTTGERFRELIDQGFFAEWARVHNHYYGTPLGETEDMLAAGRHVLFDIDVQGARQLRRNLSSGAYVFIFPPSRLELEKRLSLRGSDDPETVALRLDKAREEIEAAAEFDSWIVNDELERAYDRLRAVYLAACSRPALNAGLPATILATWDNP
jgi:guanylate kinase